MQTKLLSVIFMLFIFGGLNAQKSTDIDLAKRTLAESFEKYGLEIDEIDQFLVSDHYVSSYHNATHLYLWQTHKEVPVYNGLITIGIQDDEIYNIQSAAVRGLPSKVIDRPVALGPEDAIQAAGEQLGFPNNEDFTLIETKRANSFVYASASFASNNIPVYLCYDLNAEGMYELGWNVDLDIPGSDYYSVRVSAADGKILTKNNYTVYCSHDVDLSHSHTNRCKLDFSKEQGTNATNTALVNSMMGGTYRVYPAPGESPNHIDHQLVTDPADLVASPFGWHDTDGVEGAEETITNGNNVTAYLDKDSNDIPDAPGPDGGAELVFDFPHDQSAEPVVNEDAAITNLFYMNNFVHDFTYRHGFDEAAGNFQENNYGNGGFGGDRVEAQVADGADLATPNENNANFATPADGASGRMQMFLWGTNESDIFTVNDPAQIAGKYPAIAAQFGAPITDVAVTGKMVIVDDGTTTPTTGCDETVNAADIAGTVALIDRGECEFGFKALQVQNAGAIAAVICNIEGVNGGDGDTDVFSMAGGAVGAQVTIPAVMMRLSDCNLIRASIEAGVDVNVTLQLPQITGPTRINGSFDNGVISHEFGHGVSNRLTGGPSQAGCLGNDEQMGEGWSDFFALVMSVEPGDMGTDSRGIGTYASSQGVDGGGIRDFPYSTDMSISPKTYDDIIGTGAPHPLGEVWAAVTWDMYWRMVDKYGYDADVNNQESGNARAIRLVIEGMKEQGCLPGFLSGRDGILAADDALYDGENFCLIYDAFARRGMGYFADQGLTTDRGDGSENFLSHPNCIDTMLISKSTPPFVEIGKEFEVTIKVTNFKQGDVTALVVTDEVPEGTEYVDGTASIAATLNGDVLSFDVGSMTNGEELTITYTLKVLDGSKSETLYIDDFTDGDDRWDIDIFEGTELSWELQASALEADNEGFKINDSATEETDNVLFSIGSFTISGDRPTLKFRHRYNTETGNDGGFISVRPEGQEGWIRLNADNNVRDGYNVTLAYGTFALPNLSAFSGDSEGIIQSYLDLSDYSGQDIQVRFRFGTDPEAGAEGDFTGWGIDDFEILDLKDFAGTACINIDGEQENCATAITLIESNGVIALNDVERDDFSMTLFPNPANSTVNVSVVSTENADATLQVIAVDGTLAGTQNVRLNTGKDIIAVNIENLSSGVYFVKLNSSTQHSIKRLVIE